MKKFLENLANLVKVKTIVTFAVIAVYAILALNGTISPEGVKDICYIVIAFYFGTQHEKKGNAE